MSLTARLGIQGEEHGLFVAVLVTADIVPKPAFHAAALIVVGSAAFFLKVAAGLKAIDIEVTDIRADLIKLFDEFFVLRHRLWFLLRIIKIRVWF